MIELDKTLLISDKKEPYDIILKLNLWLLSYYFNRVISFMFFSNKRGWWG